MNPLKLFWHFFRIGALNELQYRVNFVVQLFQSLLALGTGLVGLALVFSHTTALAGWSRAELLVVMGVHLFMGGVIQMSIQPNMARLMGEIHDGTFDFALVKPVDSQVMVSVREVRIWQSVDVLMGALVMGWAVTQLGRAVGAWQAVGFTAALLCGAAMIYSFWLMLTTGAFWVVRMENIIELFQGVYQAGRWPVSIYPDWLRTGLTFLVPIAFAVTVPAEALTNRLNTQTLGLAAALAVALLLLARGVWRRGLRAYSGASA
jgi:ABC-2 type transport system permease protein